MDDLGKILKRVKEVQGHTEVHSVTRRDTGRQEDLEPRGWGGHGKKGWLFYLPTHWLSFPTATVSYLPKEN